MQSLVPDLLSQTILIAEREVLSKNYLLWVYYEKKRLTL